MDSPLEFSTGKQGEDFRAAVLNSTPRTLAFVLNGPLGSRRWLVKAGEVIELSIPVSEAGHYSLSGSPELFVATPRVGSPTGIPRQLVLVIVDALRDDHVTQELTPSILHSFRRGKRWPNMSANSSWTLPSIASLFTSRPVLELTAPDGNLGEIPPAFTTLAELLSEAGFLCAGVVSNYAVHLDSGFAQGFDTFLLPDGKRDLSNYPDAAEIVRKARAWMNSHSGEDIFLYLHLMDPHEPYHSHGLNLPEPPPINTLSHRGREATPEETKLFHDLYAREVQYVDHHLGQFLNELGDQTVVAFSADHGEALGEHGCWGHGYNLFEEVLSVPMLLRGPGIEPSEEIQPRQLLDLAPTLLQLGGVSPPAEMRGRSLLDSSTGYPRIAVTFGAGPMRWAWRKGQEKVVVHTYPQADLGASQRRMLREKRPLPSGVFLYNLDSDPAEASPVPLPEHWAFRTAQVFAATAGRFIPGLQLFITGLRGPAEVNFELPAQAELIQVWSVGPLEVTGHYPVRTVKCAQAYPFAGLTWTLQTPPYWIRAKESSGPWIGLGENITTGLSRLEGPVNLSEPGLMLWLNRRKGPELLAGGEETISRLRALGYLE